MHKGGASNSALRSECTNKEVLSKTLRERRMMHVSRGGHLEGPTLIKIHDRSSKKVTAVK